MSETRLPAGNSGQKPSSSARLGSKLDKKLMAYTAAAGAAGVSLLAQSAEAKVVYTPANIRMVSTIRNFSLDLNDDGIRDFIFSLWNYHGYGLDIKPTKLQPQNAIWGNGRGASALSSGVTIGPDGPFHAARQLLLENNCSSGCLSSYGLWKNTENKYLGFSFLINGQVHYGWARVSANIDKNNGLNAVVTGYAYETISNKSIVTGQTQGADVAAPQAYVPEISNGSAQQVASLGCLAQGVSGLAAWRREEE